MRKISLLFVLLSLFLLINSCTDLFNFGGNNDSSNTDIENNDPGDVNPDVDPPAAPSSLTATASSEDTIVLSWVDNSDDEEGFVIYRKRISSEEYTLSAGAVASDVETFTDNGLDDGTRYYYMVKAFNDGGESSGPEANCYTDFLDAPVLTGPSNVTSDFTITASYDGWSTSPLGGTSDRYRLEWSTESPNSGFINSNDSDWGVQYDSFEWNILDPGEATYYFRVRVYNINRWTDYSNVLTVICTSPPASAALLYPQYDNLLLYSSMDSTYQNTVYPNSYLIIGQNFVNSYELTSALSGMSAIMFNLSGITGNTVEYAELRLYPSTLPADTSTYYSAGALASSWSPSTITFENCPNVLSGITTVDPPTQSQYPLVFEVTNIVSNWASGSWDNNGFLLYDYNTSYPSDTALRATEFYPSGSAFGNYQPQLYVEYH